MIRLCRSNRTEALADALAEIVATPLAPVPGEAMALPPEHLVVQSRGMAQWVQLALAERHGVAAHLKVWQPRELVEHVLATTTGAKVAPEWARERLTWKLLGLLPQLRHEAGFEPLRTWLEPVGEVGRTWQLAERIAHVFDQYAVYRPELVLGWSRGEGDTWQPKLWRRLEALLGRGHLTGVAASPALAEPGALPARVLLFGLTSLPPLFLDVLGRLGEVSEVHLFQLSPSQEYWAEISSRRERIRALRGRTPDHGPEAEALLHLEEGHPLLAALGRVGRDLQYLLEARFDYVEDGVDRYVEPEGHGVLHTLQRQILHLQGAPDAERLPLPPEDGSFRVIGCHSPAREVEVLRDELLGLLRTVPGLRPRHIVVLMPDIAVHGPLIDAVFGVDPQDPGWIPYAVADRPVASGNEVAQGLLALLDRVGTRLAAPEVLDLLSLGAVRRRFHITEGDLPGLDTLVAESGIRWGANAAHREREDQPPIEAFTWRLGLDRLVLGHATSVALPQGGLVPWTDAEGEAARLVGLLVHFAEHTLGWIARLEAPRPAAAWAADLTELVGAWFAPEEERADDARRVREVLAAFAAEAEAAGFTEAVPLAVVRNRLDAALLQERRQGAFLRGGVTFCEMLPMRSIPARVVVLLGLSDQAFPRADGGVGFDLVRAHPRRGDRSKRDDDRYLVLEALLAARDAVRFTYVSRSVKDNEPLPPSVVLSDVLDALDAAFVPPEGLGAAREALTVEHPLQPFSTRYVVASSEALTTWDPAARAGARALLAPPLPEVRFLEGPIPPAQPPEEVDLGQLVRFLRDPVTWFLEQRLGVGRVQEEEGLAAREPLSLDALEESQLGARVLALRRQDLKWAEVSEIVRGEGLLPLGHLGNPVLGKVSERVDRLLRSAAPSLAQPMRAPVVVDLELEGLRVTGRVDELRAEARVTVRYVAISWKTGRHRIDPWVRHLALQVAEGPVRTTHVYGIDDEDDRIGPVFSLGPIPADQARELLGGLVSLYRLGHAQPLPFHPDLAWDWLRAHEQKGPIALDLARRLLARQAELNPVVGTAWSRLVGGEAGIVDEGPLSFGGLSRSILGPLRLHLRNPGQL